MAKITKVSIQKKDKSRVNIFIDGNFFCGLSLSTFAKYSLYDGKELHDEELDHIFKDDLRERLTLRVISYLADAQKTETQVKKYILITLIKKKGEWYADLSKPEIEELTEKVIENLKKYGYINDEKYAESFINSRLKNKPRGKSVLLGELLSKGVEKSVAQEKIDECVDDEYTVLKNVFMKKFKDGKITKNDTKKIGYLLRKGFNWDLIEQLINDDTRE